MWKNNWPCERLCSLERDDLKTLWLLLRGSVMPRQVSHNLLDVVYHPPGANSRPMTDHITECIDKITQLHPYAGVMVQGDFNRLKDDSLRSYPLTQLVHLPTRNQAVLDRIYGSIEDWYFKPVILPSIGTSDHNTISLSSRQSSTKHNDHRVDVKVRSNDTNGWNLLENHLSGLRM